MTSHHLMISVSGALRNWIPSDWVWACFDKEGHWFTPEQVKRYFEEQLSLGRVVLPLCDPAECPDFDYSGGGCPGHEQNHANSDQ